MDIVSRRSFTHVIGRPPLSAALCLGLVMTGIWAARAGAAEADILQRPDPWGQVMFLGTYHMANPGHDEFNLKADDVLSDKRQKEIEAVVRALARFKPTKIVVEASRDSFDSVNAAYKDYVNGKAKLSRNETQQIGFRLARLLGHDAVYPVDVLYKFMSEQEQALQPELKNSSRLKTLMDRLNAYGKATIAEEGQKLSTMSIGAFLRWMNAPEQITANHDFYMRFEMLTWHEDNQGGAYTIANWYTRNILIFQNILRLMEGGKGERVLVIYGQGHVKILQELTEDSPYTELVDVERYLPRR